MSAQIINLADERAKRNPAILCTKPTITDWERAAAAIRAETPSKAFGRKTPAASLLSMKPWSVR